MKQKTYIILSCLTTFILLLGFAGLNIYVDPLFHYHHANSLYQYPLYDERYMNDGITRNFEYDSIVTGTSMTENFKTSLWDNFWGTTSIKVPFSGGSYREVNELLERAFDRNPDIQMVLRSLDLNMLIEDKDSLDYEDYPSYLYDQNVLNDVNYILNKDIFFEFTDYVFTYNELGGTDTDFDTYKNWSGLYEYNEELIRNSYNRAEKQEEIYLTEEEANMIRANLEQNVIALAKENPKTEFYFFIPPYSIAYWDEVYNRGELEKIIKAKEIMCEMLVPYDNIYLYSFFDKTDIITNLNFYRDVLHYNQEVSDMIMESMYMGEGRIDKDNYREYLKQVGDFYRSFPYDDYFAIKE